MARYCTADDMSALVRGDVLAKLADDDRDGVADEAVLDGAIVQASDLIDGYCAPRYTVPFSPVPAVVRRLAAVIAVYNIFAREGFDQESADRAVVDRYRDAVRFLEAVATGRVAIGAAGGATAPPPATVGVRARARVFTPALLERF